MTMRAESRWSPSSLAFVVSLVPGVILLAGYGLSLAPLSNCELLIGFCYVVLIGTIGVLTVELRHEKAIPRTFVTDISDAIRRGKLKTAFYLARTHNAAVARVLAAGMARLPYGLDSAQEAAMRLALTLKAENEERLVCLEIIGTVGPALGAIAGLQALLESLP
jgi:biopolymer transport protein ExbB